MLDIRGIFISKKVFCFLSKLKLKLKKTLVFGLPNNEDINENITL